MKPLFDDNDFGVEIFSKYGIEVIAKSEVKTAIAWNFEYVGGACIENFVGVKAEYERPFVKRSGENENNEAGMENEVNEGSGENEESSKRKLPTKLLLGSNVTVGIKRGDHIKEIQEHTKISKKHLEQIKNAIENKKKEFVTAKTDRELGNKITELVKEKKTEIINNKIENLDSYIKRTYMTDAFYKEFSQKVTDYYKQEINSYIKKIEKLTEDIINEQLKITSEIENAEKKMTDLIGKLEMIGSNMQKVTEYYVDASEAKKIVNSEISIINAEKINIKRKD